MNLIKMGWMDSLNRKVARSFVGKYFRLEGSGHVCSHVGFGRQEARD